MISGVTSRIILGLLSLALAIFTLGAPLVSWFVHDEWMRANLGREFPIASPELHWSTSTGLTLDGFPRSWVGATLFASIGVYALVRSVQLFAQAASYNRVRNLNNRAPVEDRLDELERLKRRDMVTSEEYAAKRQEILKHL
jgi:hypothetical protein